MKIKQHSSISEIGNSQWQRLAKDAGPFLSYDFLYALETANCVDAEDPDNNQTGWQVDYLSLWQEDELLAVVPGYIKYDSYGEYVFDHGWANAYYQHGLDYYPKWIAAIPFTPVTGPRVLCKGDNAGQYLSFFRDYLKQRRDISSLHWLFCPQQTQQLLCSDGFLARYSVQFQWVNYAYQDFNHFLSNFTARKRKDIKKERKRVLQNVEVKRVLGTELTAQQKTHFYQCYRLTYLKRSGHNGYLTADFFKSIFDTMANNIMLVVAEQDSQAIASALFFYNEIGLYGRYWGALKPVDGLHFECCYYQGIEFAIEQQLPLFNPGTQGEHKLLRGFEPLYCHSAHLLHDNRFHDAVANFLQQEQTGIENYYTQAEKALPFNQNFFEKR